MMRKPAFLLLTAVCSISAGFYLLRLEGEHNYTGDDSLYKFFGGLGLFLLFAAFILMVVVYGKWSFQLTPALAAGLGIASICIAWVLWRTLLQVVSIHAWNFVLLALPMIIFLSGLLAVLIGTVRLLKRRRA